MECICRNGYCQKVLRCGKIAKEKQKKYRILLTDIQMSSNFVTRNSVGILLVMCSKAMRNVEKRTIAIIQARMGSQRFPGKTMHVLQGKPSLAHLLDAVVQVFSVQDVYVASSENAENDVLAAFCQKYGVQVYRGDENNVALRFRNILEQTSSTAFIRLNADSPLLEHRTIQRVTEVMAQTEADIVSTAMQRTYPSGMNVEMLKSDIFLREYEHFTTQGHFEHVTQYFYQNAEKFTIRTVESGLEHPERYKFSFDTHEDKVRIEQLFAAFERPHYGYTLAEKCALYDQFFPVGCV